MTLRTLMEEYFKENVKPGSIACTVSGGMDSPSIASLCSSLFDDVELFVVAENKRSELPYAVQLSEYLDRKHTVSCYLLKTTDQEG